MVFLKVIYVKKVKLDENRQLFYDEIHNFRNRLLSSCPNMYLNMYLVMQKQKVKKTVRKVPEGQVLQKREPW